MDTNNNEKPVSIKMYQNMAALSEQQLRYIARCAKGQLGKMEGKEKKMVKQMAAATLDQPTLSKRKRKALASEEKQKNTEKKAKKRRLEQAAANLGDELVALGMGEEGEDAEMGDKGDCKDEDVEMTQYERKAMENDKDLFEASVTQWMFHRPGTIL